MALFTKLFNRHHDPYSFGERWYKIVINSTGLVSSDIPGVSVAVGSSTTNITLPSGYTVVGYTGIYNGLPSSSTNTNIQLRILASGPNVLIVSSANNFSSCEIYVAAFKRS